MVLEELEKKQKELQVKVKGLDGNIKNNTSRLDKEKILLEIRQEEITKIESSIKHENELLESNKKELDEISKKLIELKKDELETTTDPEKLREIAKTLKQELESQKAQARKEAEEMAKKEAEAKEKHEKNKKHFWSSWFNKDKKASAKTPEDKKKPEEPGTNNPLKDHVIKSLEKSPDELLKEVKKEPSDKPKQEKKEVKGKSIPKANKTVKKAPVKKVVKTSNGKKNGNNTTKKSKK